MDVHPASLGVYRTPTSVNIALYILIVIIFVQYCVIYFLVNKASRSTKPSRTDMAPLDWKS